MGEAPPLPEIGLATIQILGEYQDCQDLIFRRFVGTPTPPFVAGFVFLGLRLSKLLMESRGAKRRVDQNLELICPIRR